VIGWGKAGEDGPATGITYAPPAGAYVSAPCAGRVAFAAPFHAYGKLVILECGGAYDVVLAGMDALVAPVGHSVRAGEPVGRMADFLSPAQGAPGAAKLQARSGLYMEIRSHGAAVDPSPFLNRRG
jgi:septal ring factor EnvC (AmiA/AmiB activator)